MPDERSLLETAKQYLISSEIPGVSKVLDGATCSVSVSSSYSHQRWNCYATSITVYLPIEIFRKLDEVERMEVRDALIAVFPKDAGFDITSVDFSPTLVQAFDVGISSAILRKIIDERDLPALDREFSRATSAVDTDPPAAVTAACAILESLCKIYIEDEKLELPNKQTLKPLWFVVQGHLKLKPSSLFEEDINRILSGLTSVVDGIASLRTHAGSAHGQGRKNYRLGARHARLAIHAAHTLALFLFETWDARKK